MNAYPNLAYPGQQYQQPYSQQFAPSNSNPYAQPYAHIKTNQQYPQQYQQQQPVPQQYYAPQYPQQQYPQQYAQQYPQQQYVQQQYPSFPQQQYNPYQPQQLTDAQQAQVQKMEHAKTPTQTGTGQEQEEKEKKFVVHKIEFTDTLDGLALQYSVSAREIKIFNGLTTDDIYYMKEIKIPNPDLENLHLSSEVLDEEELRRRQKLHTMRQMMDKDDAKVAQFYLEENDWDINKSIDHYKQDVLFEKQHQESLKQKKNK